MTLRGNFDFWTDLAIFLLFVVICASGIAALAGLGVVAMVGIMGFKYWFSK